MFIVFDHLDIYKGNLETLFNIYGINLSLMTNSDICNELVL